jgi:phosphohistidine phosphatase
VDLYLIRHAEALTLGERGITDDAERPLSEHGENQAEMVGKGFQRKGLQLDMVVCSPLVRARQTAEIFLRNWSPAPPEIQFNEGLLPEARPRKLARFLRSLNKQRIGLVGHAPHLPHFAAWIIGGKKAQLDIAKAGVVFITCEGEARKGQGTLHWMVGPEWFEKG